MQDEIQNPGLHTLLSRVAGLLEIQTGLQLLAIKYPEAAKRDAQLAEYNSVRDSVQMAIDDCKLAGVMGQKSVANAQKVVEEAKAAQLAFEQANPLIVRLDRWLATGTGI
ncbi:hypothetical protein [Paraburkholderia xenovorans]|uniref:hypothetical protein n=1 Tax=Paraburkholderia xenovorans TaxID=36873 RepID=UPI0015C52FBC|nr:hypothetical protein [Paraburkholderia xenovorans]NPT37407.1 hypothetical protein [Paraburkholderia xenovorans]